MSRKNPYESITQPFQSGCSLCRASTDYQKYWKSGGGNYSKDGLIPRQPSTSADLRNNGYTASTSVRKQGNLVKENYGISYQTNRWSH